MNELTWEMKCDPLSDIEEFVKIMKTPPIDNPQKPYWAMIEIENLEDIKFLQKEKELLLKYYTSGAPVRFMGFTETGARKWYMQLAGKILIINHSQIRKV